MASTARQFRCLYKSLCLPLGSPVEPRHQLGLHCSDIDIERNREPVMKYLMLIALFVVAASATDNDDPISQESNVEYNGKYHYQ